MLSMNGQPMPIASAIAGLFVVFENLIQVQTKPLVYPNKYSFQKTTTTTSTTPVPVQNHDHSDNSISSEYGDSPSDSIFPYTTVWVFVALFLALICIACVIYYIRKKRPGILSLYTIRSPNAKADFDSSQVMVR